ncbi:MAG: homoserine dehydrogenase [Bacteroidales bacterium]|nr:homoserine dehydrogenase [Bacteroidales bacterium]
MESFNVAILGCGTVGSGVAKILLDIPEELSIRANKKINLVKIVDLYPGKSASTYNLPIDLFCGGGKDLTREEASRYIEEIITDSSINLVVETIGGTSDYLHDVMLRVLKSGKHLVTANKAMLAEKGNDLFSAAQQNNVLLGYEASVCGAIPIIKTIRESFTGDKIIEISGILNGTSNYILSTMQNEGLDFPTALKNAQEAGYAEADPTLDINGGDAAHKLTILIRLAFGANIDYFSLHKEGIDQISKEDIDFANEMGCSIKLICYARQMNGKIFAAVKPMMVKSENFLSKVNGATNCVQVNNLYSGKHYFVGKGAGSLETASSVVSDIVFAARYEQKAISMPELKNCELIEAGSIMLPYNITFATEDRPGITGLVTTAIGSQNINIDTVSHNRHNKEKAYFSVVTMPCTLNQVKQAIAEIKQKAPGLLLEEPKILPILY